MEESKTCGCCGETKSVSEFYRDRSRTDGLQYVCKACDNARTAQYRKDNPFKHSASFIKTRARKKDLPYDLDAEYLESIWTSTCPVFKTKLHKPFNSGSMNVFSKSVSSLDRIIPEKGYVRGNVEWISNYANTIKNGANASDLSKVADHVVMREKEIAQHEAD